jgi:alpha-galactosidase
MKYTENGVENLKIAYIGGGSRGWAWGLMSDLVSAADISGTVSLYDINREAAEHNVLIGNAYNHAEGAKSRWTYSAADSLESALTGADFVVISILPGTFDEMESDVHTPEKYGIYQSVGDTSGPGGIVRALRTLPMIEVIARAIKAYAKDAWVINYTNPMTVIMDTLYRVFPEIKAFGCCHEVFGTQKLLASMIEDMHGEGGIPRDAIKVDVTGVNHFTWLTGARYKDYDLFADYEEFTEKHSETGYLKGKDSNWMNNFFQCSHRVKFDLFRRYGSIAAAGDRHLAEFCPGAWYLKSPETARSWGFGLTPVSWRKNDLASRLAKSEAMRNGTREIKLRPTGEDGVNQIRALLGLSDMVTNVNLPNRGQIPNLPIGAVVETNAAFRRDSVTPVTAGDLPREIFPLVSRIVSEQNEIVTAALNRDLTGAFRAFVNDPLVTIGLADARRLFDEMIDNTKAYLKEYL